MRSDELIGLDKTETADKGIAKHMSIIICPNRILNGLGMPIYLLDCKGYLPKITMLVDAR